MGSKGVVLWCHSDLWKANCNQFILEPQWQVAPSIKKFPSGVPEKSHSQEWADSDNSAAWNSDSHFFMILHFWCLIWVEHRHRTSQEYRLQLYLHLAVRKRREHPHLRDGAETLLLSERVLKFAFMSPWILCNTAVDERWFKSLFSSLSLTIMVSSCSGVCLVNCSISVGNDSLDGHCLPHCSNFVKIITCFLC